MKRPKPRILGPRAAPAAANDSTVTAGQFREFRRELRTLRGHLATTYAALESAANIDPAAVWVLEGFRAANSQIAWKAVSDGLRALDRRAATESMSLSDFGEVGRQLLELRAAMLRYSAKLLRLGCPVREEAA